MPLKLNAFSGGSVTLNPASTVSDFTLTLPAATGTVVHADTNGNVGIGTSSPLGRLAAASATGQVGFNTGTSSSPDRGNIWYDTDGSGWRLSIGKRQSGSYVAQVHVVDNGNFQFDSGYGSVATAYGCRAWVNFNGTGVVAIRGSGNVSSITDNGVGRYVINFTVAMPDTNYACAAYLNNHPATNSWDDYGWGIFNKGTSSFSFDGFLYRINAYVDSAICDVAVFR